MISIVFAIPAEQIAQEHPPPGYDLLHNDDWFLHSCDVVAPRLYFGNLAQAILTPLIVFLLPGPVSLLLRRNRSTNPPHSPRVGVLSQMGLDKQLKVLIGAGWMIAMLIAFASWFGLRTNARLHGTCEELFDLSRPSDPLGLRIDYVSDCSRYFMYLSVFCALWTGITSAVLRTQFGRAEAGASTRSDSTRFQSFAWVCFLVWAVQYRLSQWFAVQLASQNQLWTSIAVLGFCFVIVSSLWVLAFVRSLWNTRSQTWLGAVMRPLWKSALIYGLTTLTFFWLVIYAVLPLLPVIETWYVLAMAWAAVVGTWQWNAQKGQGSVAN